MAKRKIISVGATFPLGDVENLSIGSDRTLLDADIVVFVPGIAYSDFSFLTGDYFQGKLKLSESGSFRAVESATHWRSELRMAYDDGKTIFIFLAKPEEVYRYTGEKNYSGTGRNRQVTNIVTPFSSYNAIPINLGAVVPKRGKSIKTQGDLGVISSLTMSH